MALLSFVTTKSTKLILFELCRSKLCFLSIDMKMVTNNNLKTEDPFVCSKILLTQVRKNKFLTISINRYNCLEEYYYSRYINRAMIYTLLTSTK